MASNNNSMRPWVYEGSGDPDGWVNAFERYTDFTEWGPRKKVAAFKTMLQGRAAHWLREVGPRPDPEEDEYEYLKTKLLDKFRLSNASRFQLRTELMVMKQNYHEPVESYLEKIETKWAILDLNEQNKVDFFIQGLSGPIQAHVLRTQPTTLDEAVNAAKAEEAAQGVSLPAQINMNDLVDKLAEKLKSTAAVKAVTTNKSPRSCQLCSSEGHGATECPKFSFEPRTPPVMPYPYAPQMLPSASQQGTMPYPPPPWHYGQSPLPPTANQPRYGTPHPPPQYRNRNMDHVQCYACGQYGHFQRSCPAGNQNMGNTR